MTFFRRFARRLRHLFHCRRAEAEMVEEMRFHLEQRTADLAADGLPDREAHYAAQRRFGNAGRLQEEARDAWGWGWLERAWRDFRFAWRQLAGNPGFTAVSRRARRHVSRRAGVRRVDPWMVAFFQPRAVVRAHPSASASCS